VGEERTLGRDGFADVERDARVALTSVPVAPVALDLAEDKWDLIGRGFDFLQANDVRALLLDPGLNLGVARPDAVDVPGGDLRG
jgi:hypothetical protein